MDTLFLISNESQENIEMTKSYASKVVNMDIYTNISNIINSIYKPTDDILRYLFDVCNNHHKGKRIYIHFIGLPHASWNYINDVYKIFTIRSNNTNEFIYKIITLSDSSWIISDIKCLQTIIYDTDTIIFKNDSIKKLYIQNKISFNQPKKLMHDSISSDLYRSIPYLIDRNKFTEEKETFFSKIKITFPNHIENLIIITSKIIVSNYAFDYVNNRSIYSTDDRFQQTKKTIETVRSKIKNTFIILIDNSSFEPYPEIDNYLKKSVDLFLNPADEHILFELTDRNAYKSLAEAAQMQYIIHVIKSYNVNFRNLFKITGRYVINNNFVYEKYLTDTNIFKILKKDEFFTCFYKIAAQRFENYANAIVTVFNNGLNNEKYAYNSYEKLLKNEMKGDFTYIDSLGITQRIAVFNDNSNI